MTYSTEGEEVVLKSRMQEICKSGSVRGLVADSPKRGGGHEAYSTNLQVRFREGPRGGLPKGVGREAYSTVAFQSFRFHTLGPHVGTCGWNTLGRDGDSVTWRFDVVCQQPPRTSIVASLVMPWDTIDTLRTWHPCVQVKNNGTLSDSVWVALRFSDTLSDRTVYADSSHLLLHGGQSVDVSFRSIRFNVPGPYHGQLALRGLHGEEETVDWDFWVDGNLGVEERSVSAGVDVAPSVVRGVLFLLPSHFTLHSSLFSLSGQKVMALRSGANDVSALSPGVYFVRSEPSAVVREPLAVTKVVIAR